jgi:hypothetical protein
LTALILIKQTRQDMPPLCSEIPLMPRQSAFGYIKELDRKKFKG